MKNININKNHSLMALQELVEQNIDKKLSYMPESFNQEQHQALQLFKQRILLEKTIDETISFNKKINFEIQNQNLHLAHNAEDLVDVFTLRSEVYGSLNYQNEFPDIIDGLNFDKFDNNSAILFYKSNKIVTGTIRIIFDSPNKLPSEDKYCYNHMREKYNSICEISRLIVQNEKKGLNLEFKYLVNGIFNIFVNNKVDMPFLAIIEEHLKLYIRFGGMNIEETLENYGNLGHSVSILSWDITQISNFFKKAFLK